MILPYKSGAVRLTSPFGNRADPFTGLTEFHGGIDLVGQSDKTVVAVSRGRVSYAGTVNDKNSGGHTWEWGKYVRVDTSDGLYKHYYCHLSKINVRVGQTVEVGDIIGTEGTTGQVTGSHLHFEVRRFVSDKVQLNAAETLGIPNKTGIYETVTPDYAYLVSTAAGFEAQTVEYLNAYRFSSDLWRKLYNIMEK